MKTRNKGLENWIFCMIQVVIGMYFQCFTLKQKKNIGLNSDKVFNKIPLKRVKALVWMGYKTLSHVSTTCKSTVYSLLT